MKLEVGDRVKIIDWDGPRSNKNPNVGKYAIVTNILKDCIEDDLVTFVIEDNGFYKKLFDFRLKFVSRLGVTKKKSKFGEFLEKHNL